MVGGPSDLDRLPKMSSCAELDNVPVPDRRIIQIPRVRFTLGQMMIAVAILESELWPWESIREWGWKDGGFTLRLKVPYNIMWYRIAQSDKESVQAILEQHVGLVKNLS
jgi:hypothetical protein